MRRMYFLMGWLAMLFPASLLAAETLTIQQAVAEALEKNLGLLAEKHNVPIAEARLVTARLRPNPVLTLGSDYLDWLGSGFTDFQHTVPPLSGGGPPEWNARIDWLVEGGGKRQRRIDVADAARSVAQLQLLNSTRQVVLDAQNAFIDVVAAKDSLALARENAKSFESIVAVNTARLAAGDVAKVELLRSQVASLQAQNAVRQAELRLRGARTRLQLVLGRTALADTVDVGGDLPRQTEVPGIERYRALALAQRPDLQAVVKDRQRSAADIRLQAAQGKVDFTLSTLFHHQFGNAKGESLGFYASAPLPFFNRNQGEVLRASREREQLDRRIAALQASIAGEVEAAYNQLTASRALLGTIERDMLQQAREVRDTTEYSYRRGEAGFVEFLDAQRAFNDTMQTYNDARADFARSLTLIESVSGQQVRP